MRWVCVRQHPQLLVKRESPVAADDGVFANRFTNGIALKQIRFKKTVVGYSNRYGSAAIPRMATKLCEGTSPDLRRAEWNCNELLKIYQMLAIFAFRIYSISFIPLVNLS